MIMSKKIRAFAAACLLMASVILMFSGCELLGISDIPGIGDQSIGASEGCYIDGKKIEIRTPERETYSYKALSAEEKQIYSAAYTTLCSFENEFEIRGVDYELYFDIYGDALTALLNDCPEFFWLSGNVEANAEYQVGSDKGNVKISMGVYDYWKGKNLSDAAGELEAAVKEIVSTAKDFSTDFERVKYVHDTIILNTEYDTESFELGDRADAEAKAMSNTAYGALAGEKVLCGGYAKAFSIIMHELGYECEYITGTADGGAHAWNLVKLDGEYYHIDLTWDDLDGSPCDIIYSYFCLNDSELLKTHTPDPEYNSFSAEATKYNYHVYNALYLEEYSFEAVNKMSDLYDGEGMFSIKCANYGVFDDALRDLVTNGRIYDLDIMSSLGTYQYMSDEKLYVVTILLD